MELGAELAPHAAALLRELVAHLHQAVGVDARADPPERRQRDRDVERRPEPGVERLIRGQLLERYGDVVRLVGDRPEDVVVVRVQPT